MLISFWLTGKCWAQGEEGKREAGAKEGVMIRRVDGSRIGAAELSEQIRDLMQRAGVTGMNIAVLNRDVPVYVEAFGDADKATGRKMDTGTVFWSCSISKAVFGYVVMRLVDRKLLSLDTPLVRYLPKPLYDYVFTKKTRGYQDIRDDKRTEKITARMCLDHTTGFPNYRGFEPDGKLKIRYDPGTRYSYSGEGMFLLQFVLEQMTGKDYETIAREEVFGPLGMTNSSYVWQAAFEGDHCLGHDTTGHPGEFDRRTLPHAAGSMYSTIGDLSKFYTAMLEGKGLSRTARKEMLRPQIAILSKQQFGPNALVDDKTEQTTQLFYGLSVGLLKTPYGTAFFKEGHSEGWGHYSIGFPDKGIAVIILTNSDRGESIFRDLLKISIGDIYTPWYWANYIPFDLVHQP